MKLSPSWIISWVIAVIFVCTAVNDARWEDRSVLRSDMFEYYAYLPAVVIFHDLEFNFIWTTPGDDKRAIPLFKAENGGLVLKMTMGVAMLQLPFFLLAHGVAHISGIDPNGYTWIYHLFMALSAIFYATLSMFILRKWLLRFFSEGAVSLTLIAVFLGTNLFYYTTYEGAMSHVYSFFLFAVFVPQSVQWLDTFKWKHAVFTGLSFGLLVLIRPANAIVAIVPLLWGVRFFAELMVRIRDVFAHSGQLAVVVLLAFLTWMPQLWYWHFITGEWLYYSYNDERFFFNDPRILEGLFSWRKGWLLYTPVAVFSLLGMITLWFSKPARKFKWSVPIYFFVQIYIIYSWWCWWYGGSYSSRPMVEAMVVLSIPMASFFTAFLSRKYLNILVTLLVLAMVALNQFQTYQYSYGILHYDSMTKETYQLIWGKPIYPQGYSDTLHPPDYEAAKHGQRTE